MHDWQRDPLWQALAAMRIAPEGAALGFEARLAKENGWSAPHAAAVMEEYRRFLYLSVRGDGFMTPSEDVDQAWHLHLAYSRHYWDVLCAEILMRPLHHGPTEGGAAETTRYHVQYEATLNRYREVFGSEPPRRIWPGAAERFAGRMLRIDASHYWLVPKSSSTGAAVLLAAGAALAACSALAANSSGGDGLSFNELFIIVGVIALVGILVAALSKPKGSRKDGCGGGCSSSSGGNSGDGDGGSGCGGCGGGD